MNSEKPERDKTEESEAVHNALSVQKNAIGALENNDTIAEITRVANVIDEEDGKVIFTGVGKSGDVAKKITSTLNSIGVTSNFIHPVEALHGDLGVLSQKDTAVLISNSGNTDEMVELLQFLKSFEPTTVAITSNPESKLGQQVDYHINTRIEEEGAVVDLIPMASTTVTMVIGDCIANALMARNDFGKQDFGHFHPGGTIGKRLMLTVEDLLYTDIPRTEPADALAEVAVKMSRGGKGIAVIRDDDDQVLGILTDGDMRRLIESGTDLHDVVASDVMTTDPITTTPDVSAIRALEILENNNITQLVVVDEDDQFNGVIHIHDIMNQGLKRK